MELDSTTVPAEPVGAGTIQDRVQKLIDSFATLKEKYKTLKEDYERVLTSNIELDDEKSLWVNEKAILEQKISQLVADLKNKDKEMEELKEKNSENDLYSKQAVMKIDDLLSNIDLDV